VVLEAKDGHQAIDVFKRNKNRIDLVILDMRMPFNGEKAFRKLKKIKDDIKILITSGWVDDYRVQKMIDQGCNGFIQKPFNLAVLSEKIKTILCN
jgi:DNA-binding NarL/FixJ family response regulator